jgi:hypothetical protein
MAHKKDNGTIKATSAPAPAGADDLAVLHPDVVVTIAGRQLTVREYGFLEGLRLRPMYQPLLNDLTDLLNEPEAPIAQITGALARHADLLVQLMAQAASCEIEFVEGLSDSDGQELMRVWWVVNCHFFLRQARDQLVTTRLAKAAHAGQIFTKNSSSTATRPSESDAIPSDN